MRKPGLGEASQGALAGAVVGAIGGLFAVGLAPALIYRHLAILFSTPILGLICCAVSGPIGWLVGGQLGPRLGDRFRSDRAEMVGGVLGGLVPIILVALFGWYMVRGR